MNFFSKSRYLFWSLIFLVVILLTALIAVTIIYSVRSSEPSQQERENTGNVFRSELSLSPAQSVQVEVILAEYRKTTDSIVADIRNHRIQILDELTRDNPDKTLLNVYVEEISDLQKLMQIASIDQYLALKKICTPAQCQRLSALYYELYGFREQGKDHGKGQGKGFMRRYRGGKGQN